MKKGLTAALALLIAGSLGAGTYYQFIYKGNGSGDGRVSSESTDAVYVDSVSMLAGLGTGTGIVARYAGLVEPQKTVQVKLENEKNVETTYVKEGDMVKAGDKLFKYSTSEDEDKAAKGEIDIERDRNNIETSKNQIKQLQAQQKKANADEQLSITTQILEQENQIKQYEYEIKTKQIEIDSAKAAVKDSVVTSEIDGVVKSITDPSSSSNQSFSGESDGSYMTIMAVGDFRIKGFVNEQNISNISEGDSVIAFSRTDSSQFWKGTIDEIKRDSGESNQNSDYGYSSSDNGTNSTMYPFYITLETDEGLMLGQHVYIEPDVGQGAQKDGIWLPAYYFNMNEDGTAWVWAASASNKLEKRKVTLGSYDEGEDKYEIFGGLDEDDYITMPDDSYTEGMAVSYIDYTDGVVSDYGVGDYGVGEFSQMEDGYYDEYDTEDYGEVYDDMGSTYEEIDGYDWESGSIEEFNPEDGDVVVVDDLDAAIGETDGEAEMNAENGAGE